jgi:hypothetical protein
MENDIFSLTHCQILPFAQTSGFDPQFVIFRCGAYEPDRIRVTMKYRMGATIHSSMGQHDRLPKPSPALFSLSPCQPDRLFGFPVLFDGKPIALGEADNRTGRYRLAPTGAVHRDMSHAMTDATEHDGDWPERALDCEMAIEDALLAVANG